MKNRIDYAYKSIDLITLTISLSLLVIYLSTLTANYYWDGITFALQIEKVAKLEHGTSLLFHQNHLIYNALGYLPYWLLQFSGLSFRALYLLQIANAFAGAAAVAVFFRVVERVTEHRYAALISAAALAFSAMWWKLATDANAYMLSLLLLLICVDTLLSARPRWILIGLTLAAAMLIHQLASLFYPASLVAVFTNPNIEKRWAFATKSSGLAWGITITVYSLCAGLFHDARTPLEIINWAVSNPSGVSPSANPLQGLKLMLRGNLDLIFGHSFALYLSQNGRGAKLLALATLFTAIWFFMKLLGKWKMAPLMSFFEVSPQTREKWKVIAPMLMTWIAVYMIFLIFWEPWQILYRAFYLPPLAFLLGLSLSNYHKTAQPSVSGTAALAIATLALFNLTFFIIPNMRTMANPLIATAQNAQHLWNSKTVIYFRKPNEADTTFEYFNEQTEWRRLTGSAQESLDYEIKRASTEGGQVWLNKGAAESVNFDWMEKRPTGREIILHTPNAPAHYIELLPDQ